ncbi:MAG: asparagine synthase (glutamine-hydrolyzing) [Vicinamibacterales bacterium]
MCGIAGWIGRVENGPAIADRMRVQLRHRGPDGAGVKAFARGALVHTRLSIIDLSEDGAQPMPSADGRVWTVLNGEIYNHRELRKALQAKGHHFRGHSDTEVIPALYEEYGDDFVSHLRGMFAIALYDTTRERLLLVRDRFGVKPLFYTATDERLGFASEIRALRQLPGIDDVPNRQAIYDYVALSYMVAPDTLFRGIRALEPCTCLEASFERDRVRYGLRRYHQWVVSPRASISFDTAVATAEELVGRAVESQMESDVPLGSLLSGGIDSSLVSTAAHRTNGHLKTFNVQFPEGYDETWAAVAVARHIGSDHRTLRMEEGEATWERVTRLLGHTGQPFADTSMFAVHAVSRLMREHVTVALSGDGGDEGFGGYDVSWRLARFARLQRVPGALWSLAAAMAMPLARQGLVRWWLPERLADIPRSSDAGILRNMCALLREREQQEAFDGLNLEPTRRLFESRWSNVFEPGASRVERLSAHFTEVNIRLILANGYLFKVDTASMSESLEVRVPMLDEDLMSYGLTLPHHLKVEGQTCKRVLRAIADRWLPPEVANKPKAGFAIPVDAWVSPGFKDRLHDTLLSVTSPLRDLMRFDLCERWIGAFRQGVTLPEMSRSGLYYRAILLLSLHQALCPPERS